MKRYCRKVIGILPGEGHEETGPKSLMDQMCVHTSRSVCWDRLQASTVKNFK